MIYLFSFAGISIRCEIPFSISIGRESEPFLIQEQNSADLIFRFIPVKELILPRRSGVWQVDSCYYGGRDGYTVYHCPVRGKPPYAKVSWNRQEPNLLLCHYTEGEEKSFSYSQSVLNFMGLESIFLQNRTLLLHSSFIKGGSSAILFSAPSGTGKSTQAELWKQYENTDIINGDRAAIKRTEKGWTAWGLPYAGSSGIYRNECAKIAAIVVLRQGKENTIRQLGPAEAIRYLYPELMIHHWEPDFVNAALNLLQELIFDVSVFLLSCLPDRNAVQLLKETLMERGHLDDSDSSGACNNG